MIKQYEDINMMVEAARTKPDPREMVLTLNELWALRLAQEVKNIRKTYKYMPLCAFMPNSAEPIFVGVVFDPTVSEERTVNMEVVKAIANGDIPSGEVIVVKEGSVADNFFKGEYAANKTAKAIAKELAKDAKETAEELFD